MSPPALVRRLDQSRTCRSRPWCNHRGEVARRTGPIPADVDIVALDTVSASDIGIDAVGVSTTALSSRNLTIARCGHPARLRGAPDCDGPTWAGHGSWQWGEDRHRPSIVLGRQAVAESRSASLRGEARELRALPLGQWAVSVVGTGTGRRAGRIAMSAPRGAHRASRGAAGRQARDCGMGGVPAQGLGPAVVRCIDDRPLADVPVGSDDRTPTSALRSLGRERMSTSAAHEAPPIVPLDRTGWSGRIRELRVRPAVGRGRRRQPRSVMPRPAPLPRPGIWRTDGRQMPCRRTSTGRSAGSGGSRRRGLLLRSHALDAPGQETRAVLLPLNLLVNVQVQRQVRSASVEDVEGDAVARAAQLARERGDSPVLQSDASARRRGQALKRVMAAAEVLRRPTPPRRSRAMNVHEVIRQSGSSHRGWREALRVWLRRR